MICRQWRGWTTPDNADAYERIVRGEVEFQTLMWFDSVEAIKTFVGEDYSISHVPDDARAVLARFDERATHFQVLDRRAQC